MIPTWGTSTGRSQASLVPSLLLDFSYQTYLLNGSAFAAFGGSPSITFSRGTNATLIDSTGQLTFAPSNQIPNSESFTATTWTPVGLNATTPVVSNTVVAPDGTTTADSIVEDTANSTHRIDYSGLAGNSGKYAASVYLKAGTRTFARLQFDATLNAVSSSAGVQINLTNGTLSSATAVGNITAATATSEDVGNGWYRVGLIFTISPVYVLSGGSVRIYLMQSLSPTPTYTGNGSNIFVWGAQFGAMTYETALRAYNSTTPKNLLGFTEEFDVTASGWGRTNIATVNANASIAPNGTTTADKVIPNTTSGGHLVGESIGTVQSGNIYTLSVYAKADGYNFIRLNFGNVAGGGYTFFDVLNGNIGGTGGTISNAIENVGNGWFRCSVVRAASSTAILSGDIYVQSANNQFAGWAGNGTDGVLVWGAQISDSASVNPYVYNPAAALTSTAYYGPRFDYNPNVEYSTNNLLEFPTEFSNAAWFKANLITPIIENGAVDPTGYMGAEKLIPNTAAGAAHSVAQNQATTIGTTLTGSVYAKADGYNFAAILLLTTFAAPQIFIVDLTDGSIGSTSGSPLATSITNAGNGWYRISITQITNATGTTTLQVRPAETGGTTNFTGDGTSGIYAWGAQLTESSAPVPFFYYPLNPLGLLIEEARTNLLLNSETLSTQNITTTAQAYTLSFYGTGTVTLSGTSTAGPLVGTGVFPNRASLTFTPTAGTLTLTVTGTVSNAQLEAGGFATSFIPTTNASATRSADVATMVGNNFTNWYNQTAGTLTVEFDASANGSATYVSASNGTITQNSVHVDNQSGNMRATYYSGSTEVAPLVLGAIGTIGATNKIATAYTVNDFAASRNGGTVATDTVGAVPVGLTQLNIGVDDRLLAANYTSNHIKAISYFNSRLPNSSLQALTA